MPNDWIHILNVCKRCSTLLLNLNIMCVFYCSQKGLISLMSLVNDCSLTTLVQKCLADIETLHPSFIPFFFFPHICLHYCFGSSTTVFTSILMWVITLCTCLLVIGRALDSWYLVIYFISLRLELESVVFLILNLVESSMSYL